MPKFRYKYNVKKDPKLKDHYFKGKAVRLLEGNERLGFKIKPSTPRTTILFSKKSDQLKLFVDRLSPFQEQMLYAQGAFKRVPIQSNIEPEPHSPTRDFVLEQISFED